MMSEGIMYLRLVMLGILLFSAFSLTSVVGIMLYRYIGMHKDWHDTLQYCKEYRWTIFLAVAVVIIFWGLNMIVKVPYFSIIEPGLFVVGTLWIARGVLPPLFT